MKVLVLGCGPAGLVAAHAAAMLENDVVILSKARKSHMRGAQYLHEPIPGTPWSEPFRIEYTLVGTAEAYRRKVYGPNWDGTVSPEDLSSMHDAWDIRTTYDWLWDTYGSYVQEWDASPSNLFGAQVAFAPDVIVSSVPAPLLCGEGHTFQSAKIWATDTALSQDKTDNRVICNGDAHPSWYRSSRIQGWEGTEWPGRIHKPPVVPMWEVVKPLKNNCSCWPDVVRVGRYGKWEKGVLSHEAWREVAKACLPGLTDPSSPSTSMEH